MPTVTAFVCSMKPTLLRSVSRGSVTRTAEAASNDEKWMAGMSSAAKKARMTWRTMSVLIDARDAETVRELRGEGALADARGAADEHDEGRLHAAQRLPLPEAHDEPFALGCPSERHAMSRRSARVRTAAVRRRRRRSMAAATS